MKKVTLLLVLPLLLTLTISTGCGGSGSEPANPDENVSPNMTVADQENIIDMIKSVSMLSSMASSQSSSFAIVSGKVLPKADTVTCSGGGTVTVDDSGSVTTITFSNCTYSVDSVTYSFDGVVTLEQTVDTFTLTYENVSITKEISSVVDTYELDGTISYTETTSALTFDIDGIFDGGVLYHLTGDLSMDSSDRLTGTLTVTVDADTVTCIFENFNTLTATDAEYEAACGF